MDDKQSQHNPKLECLYSKAVFKNAIACRKRSGYVLLCLMPVALRGPVFYQ